MPKRAPETSQDREFQRLDAEYRAYVAKLRLEWLEQNRPRSNVVYELMTKAERARVDWAIIQWNKYLTPLAEAWWRERGYEVEWPDDNAKPIMLRKMVAAEAV